MKEENKKIQATSEMREAKKEIDTLQLELTGMYQDRNKIIEKARRIKRQIKDAIIGLGVGVKILEEELSKTEDKHLDDTINSKNTEKMRLEGDFLREFGDYHYGSNIS